MHFVKQLFLLLLSLSSILCVCQEFHIVICDNLEDVKQNETIPWLHVQIGSNRAKTPKQTLTSQLFLELSRTKYLTIINRLNQIKPLVSRTAVQHHKILNLYKNDVPEINDYTFSRLPLEEIYLKNNNIQFLGRGLFANLTLNVVDLSWNRIKSITTVFYHSNIKWILLNHNNISYISPQQPFPSSLEQLELSHNFLESLESRIFGDLRNLKELFLNHNRLTQIPDIRDLKNIVFLHFAHNLIEDVSYQFGQHPKLDFLDLSSNLINNVSASCFFGIKSPPIVSLNFNRLTNVVFDRPEKITDLAMYGNPWNCDCLFKAEKIIKQYRHSTTCDVNDFDKGALPVCIENGKCGVAESTKTEIDRFINAVETLKEKIVKYCRFRL